MPQKEGEEAKAEATHGALSWLIPLSLGALLLAVLWGQHLGSLSTAPVPSAGATKRWEVFECGELPALEQGAVTLFRKAVSKAELASVKAAQDKAHHQPYKLEFERSFGYEAMAVKGHNVTFLHTVFRDVAKKLAQRLHCLTLAAQELRGWSLDAIATDLQPRTVELITYDASRHGAEADSNLGWHSDLGSVLTTALALSSPSDYQGGAFELRQGADQTVSQVATSPGDVIVWRGWDPHRVAPVTKGRRQVLVIEWWLGPANNDPAQLRGVRANADTVAHKAKSYALAVEADPNNPIAHLNFATHLSEDMRDFEGAELGFHKALKLAPSNAIGHLKLGKLLKRKDRNAEALHEIRAASLLEPTSADFALVAAVTAVSQGDAAGMGELEAAAQLAPHQAKTHFTVATALASLNKMSEARQQLSKALAIDPSHFEALALDISLGQLDLVDRQTVPKSKPAITPAPVKAPSDGAIDAMKVAELKSELDKLGLPRSGSIATLKARLKEASAATKQRLEAHA